MAKVPFSKLQASVNSEETKISYANKSGEEIIFEVKRYLPFKEKLDLISKVINQSVDENGFYNPMRIKLFLTLETVYYYTNLSFTEKMKEDAFKLYDTLVSTGIFNSIIGAIDIVEWNEIQENVQTTIKSIYDYKNSVLGILDAVTTDYADLNLNADALTEKLLSQDNLTTLKELSALV